MPEILHYPSSRRITYSSAGIRHVSTIRSGPTSQRSMAVAKRVAELEGQLAKTRAERDELLRDVETLCMQVPATFLASLIAHT